MSGGNGLRLLGSPEVRNAILLNEIGVLVHSVGMLSREFIEKGTAFPHHLVLRRLTRGSDPRLASEDSLFSALHSSLSALLHDADRKAVAHELLTDMAGSRLEISSSLRSRSATRTTSGPSTRWRAWSDRCRLIWRGNESRKRR